MLTTEVQPVDARSLIVTEMVLLMCLSDYSLKDPVSG